MTNNKLIVSALLLTSGIFIFDSRVPIGYAVYLLYLIPIFVAAPALEPIFILFLPTIGTVLTIASFFLEPPGGNPTRAMINRGLGVFALWSISFIIMMRRQTEDALRESRQQLIHIIDFFPDATFVVDSDKKVIVWNSAMEAMSGVSKLEMIGQGDRAYSIPFYGERRRQLLDLLDHTDGELAAKYESVGKKGNILFAETFCPALYGGRGAYVWATVAPLLDAQGKRVGAIESIRDTTDRKQAEEALRTSEARFRGYFNLPLTGIAITSEEKKWIEVNDRLCDILGYTRQELLRTTWTDLTHPEDLSDDRTLYEHVISGQLDNYTLEKRFVRKDLTGIWASLAVGCVRRRDGSPDYIITLVQDITARKQAESQRDLLATAIDSAADAIVIAEAPQGTIQYVNKAFEHMTGYSRDEAIGKGLHLLDSGQQDPQFFTRLRDSLQQNGVWSGQFVGKRKDGTLYHEACAYFPVIGSTGEIINYVAIKRDVSEKLRFEAIAESVTAMDNIGYIFSGVRHELGNAINTLMMALELLELKLDTDPKESIRQYVSQSIGQVERMSDLLMSLKNYNVDESLELRTLPVESFIKKFLSLVSEGFKRKGIAIEVESLSDADSVHADPRALQQVLLNIFTNAADALRGRGGPKIILRAARRENLIELAITDNGCGMTAEQQRNLFKPLFTSKTHGTGLGMVIVKKMVTQMNGQIEIQSRENEGTTVTVSIPKGDPSRVVAREA